jgi:hypothetical protein
MGRDFVTDILDRDCNYTVRAIHRRNLFRWMRVRRTWGEQLEPRRGEAVLYFYLPSTKASGWYFKSSSVPRTPIFFEHGEPDFGARVSFFLNSIERLLTAERSNTTAVRDAGLDIVSQ